MPGTKSNQVQTQFAATRRNVCGKLGNGTRPNFRSRHNSEMSPYNLVYGPMQGCFILQSSEARNESRAIETFRSEFIEKKSSSKSSSSSSLIYELCHRRRHLLAISENPGKLDRVSRKKAYDRAFLSRFMM